MIDLIYNLILIPSLRFYLLVTSLFNEKAKKRRSAILEFRRFRDQELTSESKTYTGSRRRIWMHAASMGEFEQLVPIIRRIKQSASDIDIITTCFSPSAMDAIRNNHDVDEGLIIPIDSRSAMKAFVNNINPSVAVINRYDLWRNAILELHARHIPIMLVNATMPSAASSIFLRGWIRDTYSRCSKITAATSYDAEKIGAFLNSNIEVLPDTRTDRVLDRIEELEYSAQQADASADAGGSIFQSERVSQPSSPPQINLPLQPNTSQPNTRQHNSRQHNALQHNSLQHNAPLQPNLLFKQWKRLNTYTLVCGSTWRTDENLLIDAVSQFAKTTQLDRPLRMIIVPHEPIPEVLEAIETKIECTRLSAADEETNGHLLVDSVGLLLSIYAIADVAYVGGGFQRGVHSVTEPAGFRIPVACGPNISRSRDAIQLASAGVLTIVNSVDNLVSWLQDVTHNSERRLKISDSAYKYFQSHSGASTLLTTRILECVDAKFHITRSR